MVTENPYGVMAIWAQGDIVMKVVALLLLLMSIVSWYVIISRAWQVMKLRTIVKNSSAFWHTQSFDQGLELLRQYKSSDFNPFMSLALNGQDAVEHHEQSKNDLHGQISLTEWLKETLRADIEESAERMQSGLPILASVGSTAPFVGLFGTVWGIYHALVGIGASGQASIDKVAGPVGEALIMTAFGLAVAIPAVLGYNVLVRSNKGIVSKLQRFARQLHAYFLTGSPRKGAV
ncbi:MotA/TolQ/ExbB proton channel family protein [Agitococcus lubricus]|uniref:Biopolymer transport protein ExbB n=1 Tax=Agitococcus lubricus TaxID=1077255 RepID=A0A2T5IZH5_9GAMM|nr:MotA/TolQ/ExbB proton channel family protein [Agitococcus lubricus]PTQ89351.1 outer membrane transport energization protein ExbB [Agitococcus lubricus]